jgi:sulfate permease, SulP family
MSLFKFDASSFKGDVTGGITAGIVALPLALAFGVQSGMGAIAGLYGAIALGIFASVFGGTRTQISGPTGPMTVIATLVVAHAIERSGSLEAALGVILATFLLAGLIQIVFGILNFGSYVKYVPYPVVSGFMTGIAIITILLQMFPLIGQDSPKKFLQIVMQLPHALTNINYHTFILGALTVAIVYIMPKVSPRFNHWVPSSLLALISVSILANLLHWNVPLIGDIPEGLPKFRLDAFLNVSFSDWEYIFTPALTLAILGCLDSLLTSIVVDKIAKTRHNSNRELIGQGIGNMVSSAFGGIPGAGTTMTSVINTTTGARTRLGGVAHGTFLLAVLLGLGHYTALIPLAVLAGILITIGFDIFDYKGLKALPHIAKSEAVVMLIVIFMTVFVDLIEAVEVGVMLACLIFMKRMGDIGEKGTQVTPLDKMARDEQDKPFFGHIDFPVDLPKNVFVKHIKGPLFFGFATAFEEISRNIKNVEVLILDMSRVYYIDQTGLYALEEVIRDLKAKGVEVMLINIHPEPKSLFHKLKTIPNVVAEQCVFEDLQECADSLAGFCELPR